MASLRLRACRSSKHSETAKRMGMYECGDIQCAMHTGSLDGVWVEGYWATISSRIRLFSKT